MAFNLNVLWLGLKNRLSNQRADEISWVEPLLTIFKIRPLPANPADKTLKMAIELSITAETQPLFDATRLTLHGLIQSDQNDDTMMLRPLKIQQVEVLPQSDEQCLRLKLTVDYELGIIKGILKYDYELLGSFYFQSKKIKRASYGQTIAL
jgi:hypothetical protein